MITRLKLSTIEQGLPKYRSMLAGNDAYIPVSFESIATVTGNGSSSTLTFSSIPQTYQHLQIRGISKITTLVTTVELRLQINGDTGTNYANHTLRGDGAATQTTGQITRSYINTTETNVGSRTSAPYDMTNIFGVSIWDIHDYTSTTKFKTVRYFAGINANVADTGFELNLGSGLWRSTSAITSISLVATDPFTTTTQFALYGIKGV